MKKLIGIVAGLALIGSLSFAACAEAVSVGSEVEGMTTTYDAETGYFITTVNANVGDQATILAFTGDTLTTDNGTNIEYINQESKGETTSFTYLMKSDVAEGATYTVKIGGSNIDTPYSQKITIPTTTQEPTTYTISGAVTNHVPASYIDGDLTDYVTELYGEETLDTYKAAYAITAYLATEDATDDIVAWSMGEADSFDYIDSAVLSFEDGTYSFENVEDGTYIVVLARDGGLSWIDYAIVDGANVSFSSFEMILGDVIGAKDGQITGGDVGLLLQNLVDIENESWNPAFDVDPDAQNTGADVGILLSNLVDITEYGTDFINANY